MLLSVTAVYPHLWRNTYGTVFNDRCNRICGAGIAEAAYCHGRDITVLGRHSPDMPGVRFLKADITDADALAGVTAGLEFDYILHIASPPEIPEFPRK